MKALAKVTRILTMPPIMALGLILILYFSELDIFNNCIDLLILILFIVIIPPFAYPLQKKFVIFKGDMRVQERKLAIIFSFVSYAILLIYALFYKTTFLYKVVSTTYFISGLLIFISSFISKNNASGHMCGVCGPVALSFYFLGEKWSIAFILLVFVGWSSLYLKRHTFVQLIRGSLIPIIGLLMSIVIF